MGFFIKYTSIELVHPPMSSQEAVWAAESNDPELEAVLRSSSLYMIGGRAEAAFEGFLQDEDDRLGFDIVVGGTNLGRSYLDVYALDTVEDRRTETVDIELGPKAIRIWEHAEGGEDGRLLDWFTIDKLAWDHARGWRGFDGVHIPRELITFDLLYVGIASRTDSYDRLVERGHRKKADILANEPQRFPGARVSDEIYLFFLRPNTLYIRSIGDDWTPPELLAEGRVVADVEKAFISQLRPGYNGVRYEQYPRGRDGLFGAGLDRYGYAIAEDLVFRTAAGEFRGARDFATGLADRGDLLFIDGDEVVILRFDGETVG